MRTTSETSGTMLNPNIQIIGVPEEENKKKDHEKILEIIVENFPKVGKEIATQVQETQRVPNRINVRINHHQMVNTEIGLIIFFAAKEYSPQEKLYTVNKNKTRS